MPTRRSTLSLLASSASLALLAACGAAATPVAAPTQPPASPPAAPPAAQSAAAPTAPPQSAPVAPPTGPPTAQVTVAAAQQPTSQTAQQPKRGGTLRAGLVGDVGVINPHAIGPQPLQTIFAIWDRLLAYDASGKPQPMLAESWDFSADQTRLQFKLRKGVQFHSGRELTSDDVKWNLHSRAQPGRQRQPVQQAEPVVHGHRHLRQVRRRPHPRPPAAEHSRLLRALQHR